ncbi:hypothetical protein NXH76_23765 [Blautia schinkii]|nr:hypothetical protein [Blautia schinkii]
MTILGQMLVEDGIRIGKQEGIQEGITIWKLYTEGESLETISEKLQIPLDELVKLLKD